MFEYKNHPELEETDCLEFKIYNSINPSNLSKRKHESEPLSSVKDAKPVLLQSSIAKV